MVNGVGGLWYSAFSVVLCLYREFGSSTKHIKMFIVEHKDLKKKLKTTDTSRISVGTVPESVESTLPKTPAGITMFGSSLNATKTVQLPSLSSAAAELPQKFHITRSTTKRNQHQTSIQD